MTPVVLKFSENHSLDAQLSYLIRRGLFFAYYWYRRWPFYLCALTLLVPGILLLTPPDDFVSLKAISLVMIALAWFFSLLLAASILIKWLNLLKWKRQTLAANKNSDGTCKIYFDREKMYTETDTYKNEIGWNHFTYWAEHRQSIFLIPGSNIYGAATYALSELGAANYEELKSIVSEKLKELDK